LKNTFKLIIIVIVFSPYLFAQPGTYYNAISTSSLNFVSDLQTRIRSPYTRISYNDFKNYIENFASRNNGDGTRSVDCVYSGYEQVYTPPFAWTPTTEMSREHTWARSWTPTNPNQNTDEYSDQHNLFPTHQDNANSIRSNYPLGNVQNATYTFLEGKLGTDGSGNTVYDPRDEHKGDAARALFYMCLRYDGIGGNDWDFNWLNGTQLPGIGVDEQDLTALLDWHKQDPPDKWEVERNDYVQNDAAQENRNPFADHPEYVNYINFNDLSKLSPTYDTEPDNYVTGLSATAYAYSIEVSWTDAIEDQLPSGYLIIAYETDSYFIPIDGETYTDDTDFSDGKAVVNINYSSLNNFTFENLVGGNTYYFTMFSYNGSGTQRNYKTDWPLPQTNATTTGDPPAFSNLLISEYVEGSSNNKAVEIYNGTGTSINLTTGSYKLEFYFNGSLSAGSTISLTGTISHDDVFVLADNDADATILAVADQTSTASFFNGDDAVVLKKGSSILDVIGQVGDDPGSEWGSGNQSIQNNTLRRKAGITSGDSNPNDAFDPSTEWDGYPEDTFDGLGNPSPLPVELSMFSASIVDDRVVLFWRTETEINNYGFEIEREVGSRQSTVGNWEMIGLVEGHGNSNSPKQYSFIDDKVISGKYAYRLKQIDNDGTFEHSKIIEIDVDAPLEFELSQNYPNPFNPSTTIRFSLPATSFVKLSVFNILGEEVQNLVNEIKEAGVHTINIDASQLNSGIYFYKLETKNFIRVKKMSLIR